MKRVGWVLVLVPMAVILLPNARSLYEGLFFYVRDVVTYNPAPVQPVRRDGRYGSLYDLVSLRNSERYNYLLSQLDFPDLTITRIPIPNATLPSILVRFANAGPLTIFSAHYDKLHDDVTYQGASDNTAADAVLLASVQELARNSYTGSSAFLFTGEEETGLRGSTAFMDYARRNGIAISENVNFDNIGRGRLAIRPSVEVPGFVFTVPFYSDFTYDGRQVRPSRPYASANVRLALALGRVQPDLVVYERFTALSDSNVFQANGIDSVCISGDNMYFLEQTWHTYADRVELIDERNLDLAFDLVTRYARSH